MAHGCPVITTRAGAIPEVVGDTATLVDPDDGDALTGAIADVLTGRADVTGMIAAGRAHAATFTWASTVDATLRGYQMIRTSTPADADHAEVRCGRVRPLRPRRPRRDLLG